MPCKKNLKSLKANRRLENSDAVTRRGVKDQKHLKRPDYPTQNRKLLTGNRRQL